MMISVFRLIVGVCILAGTLGVIVVNLFGSHEAPARMCPECTSGHGFVVKACFIATYGPHGEVNLHPTSVACLTDHRDARVISELHASASPTYVMLPTAYQCDWRYTVTRCPAPRRDERCLIIAKDDPRVVCFWWRTENLGKPDQFTAPTTHMVYE